jgi:uncharacterized protein YraI
MKKLALGVAAAALMAATPASAQYAEFGFGPRGPSVHVGPGYDYPGICTASGIASPKVIQNI